MMNQKNTAGGNNFGILQEFSSSTMTTNKTAKGMMFFDKKLAEAFSIAREFGGNEGRVATLPDLVDARLNSGKNDPVWTHFVTTATAEYFGHSRGGTPLLITAHGVGPLADWSANQRHQILQGQRALPDLIRDSIRISEKDFRKLESGHFGDVNVTDLSACLELPYGTITLAQAMASPRIVAALGPRAEEYLLRHEAIAQEEQGNSFVLSTDGYRYWNIHRFLQEEGLAGMFGGSLWTLSQLRDMHHTVEHSPSDRQSYVSPISCLQAGTTKGVARFIGIRGKGQLGSVHPGIDAIMDRLKAQGKPIMVPAEPPEEGFYEIAPEGDQFFAVAAKCDGVCRERDMPKVRVVKMQEVPGPERFRTSVPGYHGWVKYATSEIEAIAPEGANAYQTGEFEIIWEGGNPKWHEAPIRFYNVRVDNTKRQMTATEARRNLPFIMKMTGFDAPQAR